MYDTASGKLVSTFDPQGDILAVVHRLEPGTVPHAECGHVLWAPTGDRLAVLCAVLSASNTLMFKGIRVTDLDGSHPQLTLLPASGSESQPVVWDLAKNAGTAATTLPVAQAYMWASDSLAPTSPATGTVSTPTTELTPVGNPAGDAAFSAWQPGSAYLRLAPVTAPAMVELPGAYVWTTAFAAWSPDGRFIFDDVSLTARLQPEGHPAPSQSILNDFGLSDVPLLPVRDPALLAVLNTMNPDGPSNAGAVDVAWRPDGRYLAERLTFITQDRLDHTIGIYDCRTGKRVVSLQPFVEPGDAAGAGFLARWSPDGQRLLLANYRPSDNTVVITIYGPSQLPQ